MGILDLISRLREGYFIMIKNAPMPINHYLEVKTSSTRLCFAQFSKCKNRRQLDIYAGSPNMTNSATLLIFQQKSLLLL